MHSVQAAAAQRRGNRSRLGPGSEVCLVFNFITIASSIETTSYAPKVENQGLVFNFVWRSTRPVPTEAGQAGGKAVSTNSLQSRVWGPSATDLFPRSRPAAGRPTVRPFFVGWPRYSLHASPPSA